MSVIKERQVGRFWIWVRSDGEVCLCRNHAEASHDECCTRWWMPWHSVTRRIECAVARAMKWESAARAREAQAAVGGEYLDLLLENNEVSR